MNGMRRISKGILQLADPKIWTASLVPFVLGNCLAVAVGYRFQWTTVVLALIVVVCVEVSKNGFNEYFDFLSGADRYVSAENRTSFSGGKKVIVDQILTLSEVKFVSLLFLGLAIIFAVPVLLIRPDLIWFGFVGLFLSIAYSVPPFRLSYRGLGEAAVGFVFGPVIVNGSYFIHAGRIDLAPFLLSLPMGFMISAVLWINEIPDVEADRKAQKWNMVARLGRDKAIPGYVFLFLCAYVCIILASFLLRNPWFILSLSSVFLFWRAYQHLRRYVWKTQLLIKANALTIQAYLFTGLLLSISSLARHVVSFYD
jgi:1,4-dihydroxy-2-naphthoate octaprenyltransferase